MTFQSCTPLLNVGSIERSLGFWRDLVGFEVVGKFEEAGVLRWIRLRSGDVDLMLNAPDKVRGKARAVPDTYTDAVLYFAVPSVQAMCEVLRAKGFDAPDPKTEDYGVEEVLLRDPDGYEVAFTSPTAG
ncbi:VOC family protein [Phenylobacterium sp.]|uniref:VOC family protein n=1 Tax=Phenylobacterium sp. TaxID=1871053 RepID=UPI002734B25B|nr:VOC family protein [Phenylobacterium sp.]MDP3855740.1 VOC family protein [Phenylobacterium sp.]